MPTHSSKTILLATDQQRSVLIALDANRPHPIAYTPYGHRPRENGLLSLLGFNGEQPDSVTGHYHLGNGYRQFNPVLMRFNSPDSWSPFGEGGLNAYGYCGGDPRNRVDPTGHFWGIGKFFRQLFGMKPKIPQTKTAVSKTVAMGTKPKANQHVPLRQEPSKVDIKKFTQQEINAQASEFQRIEQTNRWNELAPPNHPSQSIPQPGRRASISSHPEESIFSSHPLGPLQYDNYLNNAMGSATTAPIDELLTNHTWLTETPGPSRLAEKTNYTLNKIRKNIDRQLT
ncbi:RHS repeat-associated core domain-containing protein [Pseudomonas sp. TH41]|uniref:RHS repeat-associated core domain-containing protein n=1 Tax=Pseudomonas sp. TH41 TaxID=2796405 RepID=UPI001F5BCF5A|nr:RHS repeat-associated core domain-containing protein [Pseudomonas sp. TH41]